MEGATDISLSKQFDPSFTFDKCGTCCQSKQCPGSETQFLKAVTIWVNKPHVVNRRLCGSKILAHFHSETVEEIRATLSGHLESIRSKATSQGPDADADEKLIDFDLSTEYLPFTVLLRELIPKSEYFPCHLEVVIYDKGARKVTFLPCSESWKEENNGKLKCEEIPYCIQLNDSDDLSPGAEGNQLSLFWQCDHKEKVLPRQQLTSVWLKSTLLPKLVSWSHVQDICTSNTSLKLVTVDKYKNTYVQLKSKYGRELVKKWTERTDPKKYVYEDVAIAAYLLLIWEEERTRRKETKKQTFVDLGCGNGLLVYILTKEGHKGLGIDLKKRKIWDTFGADAELKVQPITPSADHLFPEYDWIIGNHSDELTPWIPVIAGRSSYHCNFFLLPCCPHDFVGKFSHPGKSQYASYLNYIKSVIDHCGFIPEEDTLRIPSTKRICFIGRKRSYEVKDEASVDSKRQSFIDKQIAFHRRAHQASIKKAKGTPAQIHDVPVGQVASTTDVSEGLESQNLLSLDSGLGSIESIASFLSEEGGQPSISDPGVHKRKLSYNSLEESEKMCGSSEKKVCTLLPGETSTPVSAVSTGLTSVFDPGEVLTNEMLGAGRFRTPSSEMSIPKNHPGTIMDESKSSVKSMWTSQFEVRPEQTNRNCQKVPENVKTKIVSTVFQTVLERSPSLDSSPQNGDWNKGGLLPLSEAAQLFDKSTLSELKSECGGLQTLLRNHSHIFQVTQGNIRLRDFTKADPWEGKAPKKVRGKSRQTFKTLLCWFHDHHPDGCPREREACLYAHGKDDLRQKVPIVSD